MVERNVLDAVIRNQTMAMLRRQSQTPPSSCDAYGQVSERRIDFGQTSSRCFVACCEAHSRVGHRGIWSTILDQIESSLGKLRYLVFDSQHQSPSLEVPC